MKKKEKVLVKVKEEEMARDKEKVLQQGIQANPMTNRDHQLRESPPPANDGLCVEAI